MRPSDKSVAGAPLLSPGTHFATYRIETVIGQGGMGVVYRAVDTTLDRTVALKVITPQLSADPVAQARFESEARLAASLDHPNIVTVYAAGAHDGVLYLAMQYIAGTTLEDVIGQKGALGVARIGRIMDQIATALDVAHAHGLVHRDVKPANILLSGHPGCEHAYLTDFGLTKRLAAAAPGLTGTGNWVGTPGYAPPEQLRGRPVDARTDIYSLGCVVYEVLTGEPPYARGNLAATMWAHACDAPPSPCAQRTELLPVFDTVIGRAMAKDARGRYPTAGALAQALDDAVGRQLLSEEQARHRATVPGQMEVNGAPDSPPAKAPADGMGPPAAITAPKTATSEDTPQWEDGASAPDNASFPPVRTGGRRRLAFIVAPLLLGAAVAAAAVIAPTGGSRPRAHAQAHPAGAASLPGAVRQLNGIVTLFIAGKRLSHVEHAFAAAAQNRTHVLERLAAFHAPPQLHAATATLRQMTVDSRSFNQLMARGEVARARQPDSAHNALRPRFVSEFNPYARRFLGRTYTAGDL